MELSRNWDYRLRIWRGRKRWWRGERRWRREEGNAASFFVYCAEGEESDCAAEAKWLSIGLGALVLGARLITDNMIQAASESLASYMKDDEIQKGTLYPPIESIREITAEVGAAVLQEAVNDGVAKGYDNLGPKELPTCQKRRRCSMSNSICGFLCTALSSMKNDAPLPFSTTVTYTTYCKCLIPCRFIVQIVTFIVQIVTFIALRRALVLRWLEFAVCLVSFSVMTADRNRGWALDSFDRYKEFRYSKSVNVIGFAYSGLQGCCLFHRLRKGKHITQSSFLSSIDFIMDQFRILLVEFVKNNTWPEIVPELKYAIQHSNFVNGHIRGELQTLNARTVLQALVRPFQYFLNPKVDKEPVPLQLELIANEILVPLLAVFHNFVSKALADNGIIDDEIEKIILLVCKCMYYTVRSYMPSAVSSLLSSFCSDLYSILDCLSIEKLLSSENAWQVRVKTGKRS